MSKSPIPSVLLCLTALSLLACNGELADSTSAYAKSMVSENTTTQRAETQHSVSIYSYKVLNRYPHDEDAFTQGLFINNGTLYESTGQYGESSLREVDLETGEVLQRKEISAEYFGEGSVAINNVILTLTWKSEKGFIHSIDQLKPLGEFSYKGEGWGITTDGNRLIVSDGTPTIKFFDPDGFSPIGSINVTLQGQPIRNINELEWVPGNTGGVIYANLWQTDWIAIINPDTGVVTGLIDLSNLLPTQEVIRMQRKTGRTNVLNGIAYDKATKKLFVTGKNWPYLYEIETELRGVR